MKNKKGFTLIELLAVVVILAILALIAIPQIANSIQKSKEKLYREQVDRILESTEKYIQENDQQLPDKMTEENFDITQTDVKIITIEDLYNGKFIKNSNPKNPLKSSIDMDNKVAVYFNAPKNQYKTVYCVSEEYYKYYYTEEEYNNIVKTVCN